MAEQTSQDACEFPCLWPDIARVAMTIEDKLSTSYSRQMNTEDCGKLINLLRRQVQNQQSKLHRCLRKQSPSGQEPQTTSDFYVNGVLGLLRGNSYGYLPLGPYLSHSQLTYGSRSEPRCAVVHSNLECRLCRVWNRDAVTMNEEIMTRVDLDDERMTHPIADLILEVYIEERVPLLQEMNDAGACGQVIQVLESLGSTGVVVGDYQGGLGTMPVTEDAETVDLYYRESELLMAEAQSLPPQMISQEVERIRCHHPLCVRNMDRLSGGTVAWALLSGSLDPVQQ